MGPNPELATASDTWHAQRPRGVLPSCVRERGRSLAVGATAPLSAVGGEREGEGDDGWITSCVQQQVCERDHEARSSAREGWSRERTRLKRPRGEGGLRSD